MRTEIIKSYSVKIFLSGPIEIAKQILRKECLSGLCVTVQENLYIYTGGEENGYVVGLINYPRFPAEESSIWDRSLKIAELLMQETYQSSALVMDDKNSYWISIKQNNA